MNVALSISAVRAGVKKSLTPGRGHRGRDTASDRPMGIGMRCTDAPQPAVGLNTGRHPGAGVLVPPSQLLGDTLPRRFSRRGPHSSARATGRRDLRVFLDGRAAILPARGRQGHGRFFI
mgnify:CR=1 FL=1